MAKNKIHLFNTFTSTKATVTPAAGGGGWERGGVRPQLPWHPHGVYTLAEATLFP